jgi:formylglycine-generating enzyme required for sulfatase activity
VGWSPAARSGKHAHLNGGAGLSATEGGDEQGWVTTDSPNVAPTDVNLTCSAGLKYSTWTPVAGDDEYLPINCVNWYEAYAFCIWDGGFLPSEAEWEYAAAGGSAQRVYPWGSSPPGASAQYAIHASAGTGQPPQAECYYPSAGICQPGSVINIAPVGTAAAGAGLWGQLDMAGEVFEWGLDSYDPAYSGTCSTDCANLTQPVNGRVARGGYFQDTVLVDFVPSTRLYDSPDVRSFTIGFRCARVP